ncbi:MAG: polysaccharide lyase 6 family protein [Opitutaceae bacterium]
MKYPLIRVIPLPLILVVLSTFCNLDLLGKGTVYQVSTKEALLATLKEVQAGDTVVMSSGVWDSIELRLTMAGTDEAPVTIKGADDGSTVVTGKSSIEIGGRFITVRDLHFRGVEPPESKSSIIYFQRGSSLMAARSRLTNCVFESCNPSDPERRYSWVRLVGDKNRVDHNRFSGQNHSGVTVQVKMDNPNGGHLIDHNHFLDRPVGDDNGFECIQIGQSQDSEKDGDCVVEYNLFERCDGETEIVSSKTGKNSFRYNTFLESAGTLTLRHGDNNLVESNVFLGNGKPGAGGIRVIGNGHTIRNNYMERLSDVTGGLIVLYTGIPDSPLNGYFAANDTTIENNLIVNCLGVGVCLRGGYGEKGRSILPKNVSIKRNVIHLAPTGELIVEGDLPDVSIEGNLADFGQADAGNGLEGFKVVHMQLMQNSEGLLMPTDAEGNQLFIFEGAVPQILTRSDVGPL